MGSRTFGLLILAFVTLAGSASANDTKIEELEARISALENDRLKLADRSPFQHVDFGGTIEVEASYARSRNDVSGTDEESDIVLATLELGVTIELNDWVSGDVLLLWEEDETEPLDLEVAILRLANEAHIHYGEFGRMIVPFGAYDSLMVTDSVVNALGETKESAILIGGKRGGRALRVGIFNGDVDPDTDAAEQWFAAASYDFTNADESVSVSLGTSFLSDLADSDGLEGEIIPAAYDDSVPGINVWTTLNVGRVTVIAEYLSATESFDAGALSFDAGRSLRPEALNLELGYRITDALSAACRYEAAKNTMDFLPETSYGVTLGYTLFEGANGSLSVALEYLRNEYEVLGGESDTITLQLALAF